MIHIEVGFTVPSCDRGEWIGRICTIGLALLLLLPACASDGTEGLCDPMCGPTCDPMCDAAGDAGPGSDADVRLDSDAGAADAASPTMGPDAGSMTAETDALGAVACFNGDDDDGNGRIDCADGACGTAAYCCVGETRASCCDAPTSTVHADFAGCTGTDPLACVAGAIVFGGPTPRIEDGGLVPYGDHLSDSGLVLEPDLDPTHDRITLQATFAATPEGCGAVDCIDVVAVGLGDAPAAGFVRVLPDIAVVARTSRQDVALIVFGDVVGSWPLTTASPQRFELEVSPAGTAELRRGGTSLATVAYLPRPHRRVLVYGRTQNHSGPLPSGRATDVNVLVSRCDVPSALERGAASELPWDGTGPSAIREGEELLLAFENADSIHLARWSQGAGWISSAGLSMPALPADAEERFTDPSLVRESDRYALYLTRETSAGRAVVRADGMTGFVERFEIPVDVAFAGGAGGVELRSPSVVDFASERWMAVVAELSIGPRIVLLKSTGPGEPFAPALGSIEESIVVGPSGVFGAFDDQEVGDPDLSIDGHGLLRLHYAGRNGARWSVGVKLSGDGRHWRELEGRARILGPGTDFDALGARAPSAVFGDGRVDLFYTANDGVSRSIGRATGSSR